MLFYQKIVEFIKNNDKKHSKYKEKTLINEFKHKWIENMALNGLYNRKGDTYSLNNIEITQYGFKCSIFIVSSLNFEKLNNNIDVIEDSLNCRIILNHKRAKCWINAKFVFLPKETIKFSIVPQKNIYNVYIGNDYSGEPILVDLKKYPHLLISGSTRSGKSKMTDCILTNLVANYKPEDLNLYLFQISKNDLCLYEDLKHTKAFATNLKQVKTILSYIIQEVIPYREKLIKPYRKRAILDNISEYNELKKCQDEQPMILLVFDETSSIYQSNGDSKEEKAIKNDINGLINKIIQTSASLSIYTLISIQRPSVDSMPSIVKAQSNSIVSFRQPNSKSSEVSTDNSKLALGLEQRNFVYKQDEWNYGIVPWIDNKEIYQIIKPNLDKNHTTIFDTIKKSTSYGINNGKKKIEFDKTEILTEEDYINKNVAKIKNYVPYNPNLTIISDKTINKGRKKL